MTWSAAGCGVPFLGHDLAAGQLVGFAYQGGKLWLDGVDRQSSPSHDSYTCHRVGIAIARR